MNGRVEIKWKTQSETENCGFHVYRSSESGGKYTKLTSTMIAGSGHSNSERVYSFIDSSVQPDNIYFYQIESVSMQGDSKIFGPIKIAVSDIPEKFVLEQNYPNPFNTQTTITFDLANDCFVRLNLYSMTGDLVRTVTDSFYSTGRHSFVWNGRSNLGEIQPSGTYVVKLDAGEVSLSKKLVLVK